MGCSLVNQGAIGESGGSQTNFRSVAALSPANLLWCLTSFTVRCNDRVWPRLLLKHFLLHVSSFCGLGKELVTVPASSQPWRLQGSSLAPKGVFWGS